MLITLGFWGVALALFFAVLGLMEAGRRYGRRHAAHEAEGARPGLGVVDGAIFGLLGLLIAFSFSGAATRYDARRALIVAEANAIGTAWMRLDLLSAEVQPELRGWMREYAGARVEFFQALPDRAAARAALDRAKALQGRIWGRAVEACRAPAAQPVTGLVLGSLNGMFDAAAIRDQTLRHHPPDIIFVMIGVLALISSMLAGYGMAGSRRRSWLHMLGFSAILALTIYVILDLEFPRMGLIRVDRFDSVLIELRESMR